MNWNKIKNFVIGGGLVLVWAVTLGFLDWRAQVYANKAVATFDIGTDQKIVDMDDERQENTLNIGHNKENIGLTQQQLRDVANILMQPPGE